MTNGDAANHWRAIEEEKLRKRIAELEAVAEAATNLTELCWGSLAISGRAWCEMSDALRAAGYLGGGE